MASAAATHLGEFPGEKRWHLDCSSDYRATSRRSRVMNNIFYIIGVVVVVALVLSYFGFR